MLEAVFEVTDNGLSQNKAAQKWGIPTTSLSARLQGRAAIGEQNQPGQLLSKRQEDRLAQWILRQESLGYAPSHSQIRACVIALLQQQGRKASVGKNWVAKFIKKRSELRTKLRRRQEGNRFDCFTPKAVN
jgi:hypothetical protein